MNDNKQPVSTDRPYGYGSGTDYPKRPPTPPPQPTLKTFDTDKHLRKSKDTSYGTMFSLPASDWESLRELYLVAVATIIFIIVCAMAVILLTEISAQTKYEIFEINHDQCLNAEVFTTEQCYDIAWKAAFGE